MKRKSIIYNKKYITEHSNEAYNLMWELMARCVYRYGARLIIEFKGGTDEETSFTMDFRPTDGSGKFLTDEDYVCVVYDDATGEEMACFVEYDRACRWLTDLVTKNDFYSIYDFDTEDKSYYEMSNLERLDQIFKAACTLEGLRTGELEDAINNLRCKEKENLKWSAVYPVTNGQAGEAIFEGSAVDCTSYIIDHPELKGKCIIGQLY